MWQLQYLIALEIAAERAREAARDRLARDGADASIDRSSRLAWLRRSGAIVAAGIARRLDDYVARQELGFPPKASE